MEALQILTKAAQSSDDKILFHCTVGEDRTGLLAGLMTQLLEQASTEDAYYNEMCLKGFSGGNQHKPLHVQKAVDQALTPLYFKVSELIQTKKLRVGHLNKKVCKTQVQSEVEFPLCGQLIRNP